MSTSSSLDAQSSVLLHVVRNIRAKCLARVRPAEVHCTVLDRLLEELYSALQNFNNLNFGSATTTDLCERCFTSITHGLRETLVGIQDEFDGFGRDDGQRELSREDRAARLDYREVPETIGDFAAQLRLLSQSLDRYANKSRSKKHCLISSGPRPSQIPVRLHATLLIDSTRSEMPSTDYLPKAGRVTTVAVRTLPNGRPYALTMSRLRPFVAIAPA